MLSNDEDNLGNEVRFAIVNPADGDIIRIGSCSKVSLHLQQEEGFMTIYPVDDNDIGDLTHFWDGEQFALYPIPQPSPYHKWINGEWVDPRTTEDLEQKQILRLEAKRQSATLGKREFIMKVCQAGIISKESGLAVLDGVIPSELDGMVATLDEWQLFDLQVKLKAAVQFDRSDPFIISAGQHLGMTPEDIDELYGITI